MQDLEEAARAQLLGRLTAAAFDLRVVPKFGLDRLVVEEGLARDLHSIVQYGKARDTLVTRWGFGESLVGRASRGVSALLHGPPGTGKTLAAEAIGYDLGRPLKVVDGSELLSKWVGESAKNIAEVFREAQGLDAVLVFDEADALFGARGDADSGTSSSRHDTMNTGVLLRQIEAFPGVCIVCTNRLRCIDDAFFRRFSFVLEFRAPEAENRRRLWEALLPAEAPRSSDVDLRALGGRFELTGGQIKSALVRAATRAALRSTLETRVITQKDLEEAADEETKKSGGADFQARSMYA